MGTVHPFPGRLRPPVEPDRPSLPLSVERPRLELPGETRWRFVGWALVALALGILASLFIYARMVRAEHRMNDPSPTRRTVSWMIDAQLFQVEVLIEGDKVSVERVRFQGQHPFGVREFELLVARERREFEQKVRYLAGRGEPTEEDRLRAEAREAALSEHWRQVGRVAAAGGAR